MSGEPSHEYIFKYIIIGDVSVGKSCLLYQEEQQHTIGVEFGSQVVKVKDTLIKLQIWDTAGQERFKAVTRSYFRGAAGALLVYDITRKSSFNGLTSWLTDAKNLTNANTVILMVGNKTDLEEKREVSFEEASKFAEDNGLIYIEASAKDGGNVEKAFVTTAKKIYENIEKGVIDINSHESGIQYTKQIISDKAKKKVSESTDSGCCK